MTHEGGGGGGGGGGAGRPGWLWVLGLAAYTDIQG